MDRKTVLDQKRIGDVSDALKEFMPRGDSVPIVLVPNARSCLSCCLVIPSGPYSVLHRFGKDVDPDALAPSGLQCLCSCYSVAYVVSPQAVTYTAPVKACPTADNVMVDCDLNLVFTIGPDPRDVKKFVYKLGARRFDEFLFAALQEGIRHLIRTCNHNEVYELKGGSDPRVQRTLAEMQKKFSIFGVKFQSCAITDVRFSRELQTILQQTTEFQSKISEEEKRHTNEMETIEFQRKRELPELDKQHMRVIQDLQAQRTRTEIERDKLKLEALARAEVAIAQEHQNAKVAEVKATSEKAVAKQQGLKTKEERVSEARSLNAATRIRVKAECEAQVYNAQQRALAAERLAEALLTEADAEAQATEGLKIKREHELRIAKSDVLEGLANRNKIVIAGDQGERLISEILDNSILGSIKL